MKAHEKFTSHIVGTRRALIVSNEGLKGLYDCLCVRENAGKIDSQDKILKNLEPCSEKKLFIANSLSFPPSRPLSPPHPHVHSLTMSD